MKQPTPFGFWVAGAFSAWFGLAMAVTVLALEPNTDSGTVLLRGGAGLLAVLSAVVTEALWRVRPWVWRASLTLALAYAVIVSAVFTAEPNAPIGDAIIVLMASAVVVVPLLIYIHGRAQEIWPPSYTPRYFNPSRVPHLSPRRRPWQRTGGQP